MYAIFVDDQKQPLVGKVECVTTETVKEHPNIKFSTNYKIVALYEVDFEVLSLTSIDYNKAVFYPVYVVIPPNEDYKENDPVGVKKVKLLESITIGNRIFDKTNNPDFWGCCSQFAQAFLPNVVYS